MPLDRLQIRIIRILKDRRSRQSFVGGSSVFNETYPRISNDIDIYAEDVPAGEIAKADADAMTADGLKILSLVHHYGFATDAMVTDGSAVTAIEWNEADRGRFYPIQRHETFGWALHKSDLAIQKLIAAATRHKARDSFDVSLIDERYMKIEIAALAAPAKFGGISPVALLEKARANAMGIPAADFDAIRQADEGSPKSSGQIKLDFGDRIQRAIETLANCPAFASPGFLYLNPVSRKAAFPTKATEAALVKHAGVTTR